MNSKRTSLVLALLGCVLLLLIRVPAQAADDPLPSWNDGPVKAAIVRFVEDTTRAGTPTFIAPSARIATFDNDGTLWAEQPMYFQFLFATDRIRALAPQHPEWKNTEPFKSVLAGDTKGLAASGQKGVLEIVAATHAGMTIEEFQKTVDAWVATARHPKTHRPFTEMVYQPMLELLAYLRANGYKTYIVSGGGVEFMRTFAERVYGIPPEQVIGSAGVLKYELRDGKPALVKEAKIALIDDGPGKPVGIQQRIGQRPLFAFGNSDGDLQMLQWTMAGRGPCFAGIVHHTDAEREWAYDRASHIGRLDKAWDEAKANGWTVVDMQRDWKVVFPAEK